ncbi:MAG: hypothetical protein ACREFF_02605 [Candidatus Udaeobacter sp.]
MKKHTLIVTVIAAAMFVGMSAYSQSTPTATPMPDIKGGCNHSSWNTELYGFCGGKPAMIEKLANLPINLSERRVFLQVTQGSSSGEVKLYERQQDGTFTVTVWSDDQTFKLLPKIDKAIFDNKGVNCVGEQVTAVLRKELKKPTKVDTGVAAPETPAAAFKHSIEYASGEFIRTTIVILC